MRYSSLEKRLNNDMMELECDYIHTHIDIDIDINNCN